MVVREEGWPVQLSTVPSTWAIEDPRCGSWLRGWQHIEIWGCWSRKEGEPWPHPGWVCRADWPLGCRQWERRGEGESWSHGLPSAH